MIYENLYNDEISEYFEMLDKKIIISKIGDLIPDNCCFENSNLEVFTKNNQNILSDILLNKCGTLEQKYLIKNCGFESYFWNQNIDKYILITKENPNNDYKSFAKYNDEPVWFATNNILEYKPNIFNTFSEADDFIKKYMDFSNNIGEFPPMFSCVKINIDDSRFKALNINTLGLCGLNDNFWDFYKNKIVVISYLPTFNSNNINLEPFAYYNSNLIWIYCVTNTQDMNDVMEKIVIPLNISYMWKWKNKNKGISFPFIVNNKIVEINENCINNPDLCNMKKDDLKSIKDYKYLGLLFFSEKLKDCGDIYGKKVSIINRGDNYDSLVSEYIKFNVNILTNALSNENKKILEHYKGFMNNSVVYQEIENFNNIDSFALLEPPPFSPRSITFPENVPKPIHSPRQEHVPRQNNNSNQREPINSEPVSPIVPVLPIVPSNNDTQFKKYDEFLKKRTDFIKAKQTELKYLEIFNFSCFMVVVVFIFLIFGGYFFINKDKED